MREECEIPESGNFREVGGSDRTRGEEVGCKESGWTFVRKTGASLSACKSQVPKHTLT